MAIIIEQEKRNINWFALSIIVLVITVIIAGTYYLFFADIPFVEKVAPARLKSLEELSNIKLQPEMIINNSKFQTLKQYINPIESGEIGKINPFVK
ncbi:hypothetical protein JW698_01690 [Candidatus Wolfebacteria bacterium]|nr:hypothetical protein [Candidatus Wolfebacteria bacterium]